jgi:parallel beta-helix repeat protein
MEKNRLRWQSCLGIMLCAVVAPALACIKTDTRFAATSNTLYIETAVTCTPTQLAAFLKPTVLELVDPVNRIWLLKANLRLTGGGALRLYGTAIGGDTNEFRLLSANSPVNIIRITPRWGTIDIRSTRVLSWDPATAGPDLTTDNGRSYINAESFLDGSTPRESRMDILDSEISYLGFYDAESYGLVWKVLGDPDVTPNLYSLLNVYGSVRHSHIHHNYMGFYSFGGQAIEITDNEMDHNEAYGIDPHDDSDFLVISRNVVHDNGTHGIICSRRCNGLTITDNDSYNNDHGIMLHRDVTDTLVQNNHVHNNRDNGIAVFESHYNRILNNVVEYNMQGIRLSLGSHDNLIEANIVRGNQDNGLYLYQGSDPPETTDGRPKDNEFRGNTVVDNGRLIKARSSDRISLHGNTFTGNTADIEIYDSSAIDIVGNTDQMLTMDISSDGSVSGSSYVHLETDRAVKAKLATGGVIDLTNSSGRILDPEENTGTVLVSPTGSLTSLTTALIGTSTNVAALPIYATTSAGGFSVEVPVASPVNTTWTVRSTNASQAAQFRVGQLTPGTLYGVYRNNTLLLSISSGASGQITFPDVFPAGVYQYSVRN